MPRPRTPTRILQLNGAYKNHPERKADREGEPVNNDPLGGPDARLEPTLALLWVEVQGRLVEGVALESDRYAFESMVRLIAKEQREGGLSGPEGSRLNWLMKGFGMIPSERSRVKVPPSSEAKNPFAALG